MKARARKKPLWEPGLIPAPGELLDWRDARHFERWQDLPCVLCGRDTPMRSHHGEPVHKVCAENWITADPVKARQGRFASDVQPKRGKAYGDHA
ncbi:hypothetical protein QFZ75_000040 [Streptomyces sp. V3I8]|uniref:hypothetical protein n=1 Tax=Streptomyces sp. V3I8 TaxID=3042279 RepID=UPI00277E270E|nr:hypothetical protein [Streptomyces sp. V3I8]MDQ1033624.1 hypothetical protein [Streptomyces sp. V3I8]